VTTILVSTLIDAPPMVVWEHVRDIASHVGWMEDAVAIRFTSASQAGVGTTFVCDTRVGPLRLTDHMEVTEWEEPRRMGIRHVGVVKGTGRFSIEPSGSGTLFTWEERLSFPWWLGGELVSQRGARVLSRIWRRNLSNLKALVERRPDVI
jgi:carbon monoxide dehydrogenase subunit G